MDDLQIAEDLEAAVEAFDRWGWRQGSRMAAEPNSPACLVEAMGYGVSANMGPGWRPRPLRHNERVARVIAAVQAHLGLKHPWSLISWNDHRDRTEDEVRDALLETAKGIRNAHREVPTPGV